MKNLERAKANLIENLKNNAFRWFADDQRFQYEVYDDINRLNNHFELNLTGNEITSIVKEGYNRAVESLNEGE